MNRRLVEALLVDLCLLEIHEHLIIEPLEVHVDSLEEGDYLAQFLRVHRYLLLVLFVGAFQENAQLIHKTARLVHVLGYDRLELIVTLILGLVQLLLAKVAEEANAGASQCHLVVAQHASGQVLRVARRHPRTGVTSALYHG